MDTDQYVLIIILVVILLTGLKILTTISKIRRIRSSGSNVHKKDIFYKIISKLFMKDLPD